VIFIDHTVAIHLLSDDQRRTSDAQLSLERAITAGDRLVTDSAVMHEILIHYHELGCPEAVEPASELFHGIIDEVLPVEQADVVRAREMGYGPERLSPSCCLHLAVMERHGVTRIMSFDGDYDRYSAVTRLAP
jgi:predicted nucleic acid-binding protein